ncbi:BamA/TamA family outer membrane protein [Anaeromyxobacter oryzae]|uniref:Membrane protein n=1 Tax=Anaeromyxobacter oryzae TaxID=2918170 RepID=A0ABM7WY54_9BACT|nr:BamA/TamA family outer membrane protein [Anaeromyxobacter oryzae]BDG04403.1 membrane protein [Anaeromyxobacter oryzae]
MTALAVLLAALLAADSPGGAAAPSTAAPPAAPATSADAPAHGGAQTPASGDEPAAPAGPAPTPETPAHPAAAAAVEATMHQRTSWFALPVLFWLPETRLGFGATGGLHFHLRDTTRPSSVFAAAVYTLEKQGSIDVAADVYTPGGALVSGRARAVHFPDIFYGIGPNTQTSQRETFTRRYVEAVATVELPIPRVPGLRAGPRLDLRAEEVTDAQPGGVIASGTLPGSNGYSAAGVGGSVTWDTRDNAFWSTRGTFAEAWYVYSPQAFGKHEPFGRGVLEWRRFFPLGGGRVLGLQAYGEGAHGTPPFTLLPKIGSTRFLRGIREGRYRDRLDWATQAELRVPVRGRFSAVAFAGIGDVAPSLSALTLSHPKAAGGVGLRFRLTDAGANIRVDCAIDGAGPEVYVLVLEAF